MNLTAFGLSALILLTATAAGAQTVETRSNKAAAAAAELRAERERIRRLNRALLVPRDATRDERQLKGLQQLQNRGGFRSSGQSAPESAPANRQNGTVRTQ